MEHNELDPKVHQVYGENESIPSRPEVRRTIDKVLSDIGFGRFQLELLILMGGSVACDSMEICLIGFLQGCVKEIWNLSGRMEALLAAAVFVGQVIGMLGAPLADTYGRRPLILTGWVLIVVFGFSSVVAPNYWVLVSLRAVVGVGIGLSQTTSYDMVTEMLAKEDRSKVTYSNLMSALGGLYMLIVAWTLLNEYGWRILTLFCAFPILIIAVWGFFFLPESPRWLVAQGRTEDAENVLENIAVYNDVKKEVGVIRLIKTPVDIESCGICEMFSSDIVDVTWKLWIVWFFVYFTYYCMFLALMLFLESPNNNCSYNYLHIMYAGLAETSLIIIAILVVDWSGRCLSQLVFFGCAAVFGIAFSIMNAYAFNRADTTIMIIAGKSFVVGGLCIMWVHCAELFPTELRATGHSSTNIVGRIGAVFATFWIDAVTARHLLLGGIFFSCVILVAAMFAYALPETGGKSLDRIVGFSGDESSSVCSDFERDFHFSPSRTSTSSAKQEELDGLLERHQKQ